MHLSPVPLPLFTQHPGRRARVDDIGKRSFIIFNERKRSEGLNPAVSAGLCGTSGTAAGRGREAIGEGTCSRRWNPTTTTTTPVNARWAYEISYEYLSPKGII